MIPVFIGNADDEELSLNKSKFRPIWEVINAFKAHDNILSDELDQIRTELGKNSDYMIKDFRKIFIDVPENINKNFTKILKLF